MIEAFPLTWPQAWPRTERPTWARFRTPHGEALNHLLRELNLLGARDVIISSNVPVRRDGLPYAGYRTPEDPGVAVYFKLEGEDQCIPCDKWNKVSDNIHAVGMTVAALRGLERWGAKEMVNAAFRGFKALPAPGDTTIIMNESWYSVLGLGENASKDEIRKAYKEKAKLYHPDVGGDEEEFNRIRKAFETGMAS